jgi:hypothetical protein|nr:hypothetical protein [Kofleriaceae bacterium]
MVSPARSKELIELGSQLVAQLDRKDDLLASWMSHYLAELIDNVGRATADAKPAAQEACAQAILDLWRRRSSWPEKARPFVELEPALRTLASLDVERPTERYYARERRSAATNTNDETRKWLSFASDVDKAARYLIRKALHVATISTAEAMSPWLALAKNAEIEDSIELSLLEFIVTAHESGDAKRMREANLRLLLSQIETFLKTGATFADEIRSYLADAVGGEAAADEEVEDDGDQVGLDDDELTPPEDD